MAYVSDETLFLLFLLAESVVVREITQCPYYDTCNENDAAHLFQVLFSLLPCMPSYGFCCREAVGWEFHYERRIFAFEQMFAEQTAENYGHDDAHDVKRHHYA